MHLVCLTQSSLIWIDSRNENEKKPLKSDKTFPESLESLQFTENRKKKNDRRVKKNYDKLIN